MRRFALLLVAALCAIPAVAFAYRLDRHIGGRTLSHVRRFSAKRPPAPTGLTVGGITQTAAILSWLASSRATGYQTFLNGASVATTSSLSYTFTGLTCGTTYSLGVDAFNSAGSSALSSITATTSSCAAPVPPGNTSLPVITGTPQQGSTLTVSNGSWSGDTPMTFAYQWQDDGTSNISGATSSSYTAQASDVGHTLDAVVTASNDGGSASATSAQTAVVTASSGSPPVNTAQPTISGTTLQGQTLTAANGAWANAPTSYAYQWQDCDGTGCVNVTGATSQTYTLAAGDVGHAMEVVVTAANAAGQASATSSGTTSPSFNATGASPTVLGALTPAWQAPYNGSPGVWGVSSNGCNGFYNDPAYTGWWGFDGVPSGYIGTQGFSFTNSYFTFTSGASASSPAFAGQAAQLHVDQNAVAGGEAGQRANVYQCPIDPAASTPPVTASPSGAYEGSDVWYRFEVYFPSNYIPEPGTSWNWVAEAHNYPNGTCCANFSLGVITDTEDGGAATATGRLSTRVLGGGCPTAISGCAGPIPAGTNMGDPAVAPTYGGAVNWFQGPSLTLNHWYDVLMHITWKYETSGVFQEWIDGRPIASYTGPTLYYLASSSGGTPNYPGPGNDYLMVDNYRWGERISGTNSCSTANCDTVATSIVHDQDMWGSSRASVGG